MSQQLPYAVSVWCSGGWRVLARFAGESDAYEYALKHIDARVFERSKCIAEKRWSCPVLAAPQPGSKIPMVTNQNPTDDPWAQPWANS